MVGSVVYFDVLCNISFKEDLPEDDQNEWPKHEADYDFCNTINLNVCIRTLVVYLVLDHQCIVMNHLVLSTNVNVTLGP